MSSVIVGIYGFFFESSVMDIKFVGFDDGVVFLIVEENMLL